ncbi:hypothetical protein D3C85_1581940 [compost metagenome]
MQHVEAGFIGGKPSAFDLHPAETAHVNAAILTATPRATPLLQLGHFRRAMMDEVINNILFAKPVAPGNRVVEMIFEAVMILRYGGGPSFCGNCVAAHGIDF